MAKGYLHERKDFLDLIRIVADEQSIDPVLIEKDYWIMHCLYGLQEQGFAFELKGGTSLSKGFGIIERFSEDIDICIHPPQDRDVKIGRNQNKPSHVESRQKYYDWLAEELDISGIVSIERDDLFDDQKYYRSGGIRLNYDSVSGSLNGLKEGIVLEVGFDDVTPNTPRTITSWAYEHAHDKVDILDNRAIDVACYDAGYTFVEKLQTISTKYRQQQEKDSFPINFLRHYYDVYCLLQDAQVQAFIGTPEYIAHKKKRFRTGDELDLSKNEAFHLSNAEMRALYQDAYDKSRSLYYREQPAFEDILKSIGQVIKETPF